MYVVYMFFCCVCEYDDCIIFRFICCVRGAPSISNMLFLLPWLYIFFVFCMFYVFFVVVVCFAFIWFNKFNSMILQEIKCDILASGVDRVLGILELRASLADTKNTRSLACASVITLSSSTKNLTSLSKCCLFTCCIKQDEIQFNSIQTNIYFLLNLTTYLTSAQTKQFIRRNTNII